MVIFTSIVIVIIYFLVRRLWGWKMAFLGTAFIALDPHLLSLSRIIGHDAPVAMFMTVSLLLLLLSTQRESSSPNRFWLIASGLAGGLAWLSKSPAFFLGPFVALYLWISFNGNNTKTRRHEECGFESVAAAVVPDDPLFEQEVAEIAERS